MHAICMPQGACSSKYLSWEAISGTGYSSIMILLLEKSDSPQCLGRPYGPLDGGRLHPSWTFKREFLPSNANFVRLRQFSSISDKDGSKLGNRNPLVIMHAWFVSKPNSWCPSLLVSDAISDSCANPPQTVHELLPGNAIAGHVILIIKHVMYARLWCTPLVCPRQMCWTSCLNVNFQYD